MSKYINADKLKEYIEAVYLNRKSKCEVAKTADFVGTKIIEYINEMPSVVVVEVKHGKNLNDEFYETDQFICSECGLHLQDWERIIVDGEIEEFEFNFCPKCGADMRGEIE